MKNLKLFASCSAFFVSVLFPSVCVYFFSHNSKKTVLNSSENKTQISALVEEIKKKTEEELGATYKKVDKNNLNENPSYTVDNAEVEDDVEIFVFESLPVNSYSIGILPK